MEDIVFTPEEVRDISEVRDLVRTLPERAKVEIVKGMAMFEAGYKTGFFDGARNAADGAQQPA
ncbi:hypothetical protein [uncultured Selenomonas sp.]|jgi:hypothetical protein|uniref:hypothetical protein n=1 Tax=uncultured Selenomonas sp. TaxID=159275 RepID=UPI0028D64303|nr:hypothetical protein [uncultured Selenomonas sp.]